MTSPAQRVPERTTEIRLTKLGWYVLALSIVTVSLLAATLMAGKCWNNAGFGYTTCEWSSEEGK
jgi:hypothetical protein